MVKNLLLWLIIAAVLLTVFQNFNMQPQREQLNYSEFLEQVQGDRVSKVTIDGLLIVGDIVPPARTRAGDGARARDAVLQLQQALGR